MKVLVVTTWFPTDRLPASGAFIEKDVRALARTHDVEVVHLVSPAEHDGSPVSRDGLETLDVDGLTVHRTLASTQRPDQLRRAGRLVRPLLADVDVLHTMAFSSVLPFALGRRPALPWVHTEHWQGVTARWHLPRAWRMVMPVLSRALLRPDVVTAVSRYATAPIARMRGSRPTSVVPCIAESPAALVPRPARTGPLRLVAVGGLVPMKDPALAVRTVAVLRGQGHDVDLTWVGDGPLRTEVETEVTTLGLDDHVHLVGTRDAEGVAAELGRAHLFFLPTRRETFGVAIAEALAHGRPVVVGATGAQGEYLDPAVGALVAEQEPAAYADALLALDARTRDLAAEDVAATVRGRFDADVVVAGYEAAYSTARARRAR